jgi:hypothetical protein
MNALRSMAAALGGDVAGASILCPGPGHPPRDRSLSVTLSLTHPDGFVVYSHANDAWQDCRKHVLVFRLSRLVPGFDCRQGSPSAVDFG